MPVKRPAPESGKKALARWTIGPARWEAFDCLQLSLRLWERLYGNEFDRVVCHNGLGRRQLAKLKSLSVPLIDQSEYVDSLRIRPSGPAWKLYPPRLRSDAHEIFIDNDLVIYSALPAICSFLASKDLFIITEAVMRKFGAFDASVKTELNLNTGLFGLPPGFDFAAELAMALDASGVNSWETHFCEQGIVASIVPKHKFELISLLEIGLCYERYSRGTSGMHFVGLNGGCTEYWHTYLSAMML